MFIQKQQGKTKLSLQEVVGTGFGYEQYFLDEKLYELYQNNDPKGKIIPTKGLKFNPDMTIGRAAKAANVKIPMRFIAYS